jgi:hypothetical protein
LGDRRYSSYSFLTSALERGEWSASRPGRALPPGKEPPVPIVQEAWWAPEPVWTQRLEEKPSASVGDGIPAVQSVVRHCTDRATPPLKVNVYKTIILPVDLYVCEIWSLTLREEHRLRVFGNRVVRRIFGPKRDEVTGEWRKLHNGELHNLYSSLGIIRQIKSRRMRWAGHVASMREGR